MLVHLVNQVPEEKEARLETEDHQEMMATKVNKDFLVQEEILDPKV